MIFRDSYKLKLTREPHQLQLVQAFKPTVFTIVLVPVLGPYNFFRACKISFRI